MNSLASSQAHRRKFNLILVISLAFLDFLGFALTIPLLPLLLLDTSFALVPIDTLTTTRYILLGALLACYPLGQIAGAPLLGAISDHLSRKRVLLLSYLGNILGYSLCLLSIMSAQIGFFFLGNFLAGIMGVNVATTNTIISDLSKKHERTRRFSLAAMALGSAFIIGPFVTGFLLKAYPRGDLTPFGLILGSASGLSLINFVIFKRFYTVVDNQKALHTLKLSILRAEIWSVLKSKNGLKLAFTSTFLLYFGWYYFIKFFQVFLINILEIDERSFCWFLSYFGLCCLVAQVLFYTYFSKHITKSRVLKSFTLALAIAIFSFLFIKSHLHVYIAIALFSIAYSFICPCLTSFVSTYGDDHSQGKIMGLYQAAQSIAKVLSPVLAGLTMCLSPQFPIWISFLFIGATSAIFHYVFRGKRKSLD
ncbi:MAG: MFS transporter [Parachlamydiales bacterium]|nr:MFS transporter [Parachlamydiales bacterium]